jgi:hypothetical protein
MRDLILRWMSLRARRLQRMVEVYWMEDLKGLLLLADWSDDPEITPASALLDDVRRGHRTADRSAPHMAGRTGHKMTA